ncbi:hypothetical protein TRIUR3_11968 [Triticum urartu]|uniref:Uncharacterized protein n=1 Tax=Triticum urartu TaxID=4572 RepID=M8AL38_TRIUA|nr:hypothetical protein TRIUR3_11968 [Triticum urartu]
MAGLGHLVAVVVLAVVAGLHAGTRSNAWIQQRGEEAVVLTCPHRSSASSRSARTTPSSATRIHPSHRISCCSAPGTPRAGGAASLPGVPSCENSGTRRRRGGCA